MEDDRPDRSDDALFDNRHDSRMQRNRYLPPRGPQRVSAQKTTSGLRLLVYDWSHDSVEVAGSSTTEFLVFWAENVDMTTDAGIAAGAARTTLLSPSIPTAGDEARPDQPIVWTTTDAKYSSGYFFVRGKNIYGQLSEPTTPVYVPGAATGSNALPSDLEHFQASESGEQHGDTVLSVVSYSFRVPYGGGPVDRVQFMYLNYPNLNEFAEGESRRVVVPKGGTQTGKLRFPIGRRIGAGSISIAGANVTGVGTDFMSLAALAGGDQLEVFGVRARILSVTSNTAMTLTAAWTGPDVTGVDQWQTIAKVRIFAVAEGYNGARRDDPENAPYVDVDLDGDLSVPVAPTLSAIPVGNAIRLEVAPPVGTDLVRVLLYKKKGTGLSFDKATWDMIHSFAVDHSNSSPTFQHDDSDFTKYNRENNEVFSYAATCVNARDQESEESNIVEAAARLDSPSDNGDTVPAREIALNQLWNGHINGTAGAVAVGDAGQDANMGGAPPAGRSRWFGLTAGVGVAPGHVSATEVVLAMSGAGGGTSALCQEIDSVDHATAANRRIPTWKMLHLQIKARTSGGQPNGILYMDIEQYNGAAQTATAGCVRRLSDDTIDTSQLYLAVNGSDILTEHQVYHAAFVLDDTVVTTKIRVRIYYIVTNWNGVNVYITEAMLSIGEAMPQWTPQMADPSITYSRTTGVPIPPSFDPDAGAGKPWAYILEP